jgi:8-oxo-dGTP pyrophosphatase MutT (NUDIX family)
MFDRALLRAALAVPAPHRVYDRSVTPEARPSAVVVPIALHGAIFVIERSRELRDHAGELSFPGGKPEAGDRDLAATALRELEEETAVAASQIEIIGALEACPVITGKYVLEPFAGVLADGIVPRDASAEVARVHRMDLAPFLRDGAHIDVVRRGWRGRDVVSAFFAVGDRLLYGASAAIAHDLIERICVAMNRDRPALRFADRAPWEGRY